MAVLIFLTALPISFGDEERDGFVVTFFDKKVKVLTPTKEGAEVGLSLENSTLGQLSGKVISGTSEVIAYFTLETHGHRNISVGAYLKKRVFVIPLNPPGQEIELKIGRPAYEIPPSEN